MGKADHVGFVGGRWWWGRGPRFFNFIFALYPPPRWIFRGNVQLINNCLSSNSKKLKKKEFYKLFKTQLNKIFS